MLCGVVCALCCVVLCFVVLCCGVFCLDVCAVLCCVVLCCVVRCCCAVMCCAVLCCVVRCCCAVMCCAVPYRVVLCMQTTRLLGSTVLSHVCECAIHGFNTCDSKSRETHMQLLSSFQSRDINHISQAHLREYLVQACSSIAIRD